MPKLRILQTVQVHADIAKPAIVPAKVVDQWREESLSNLDAKLWALAICECGALETIVAGQPIEPCQYVESRVAGRCSRCTHDHPCH